MGLRVTRRSQRKEGHPMPDERITSWQPIAASSGNDAEWHAIHAGKELGPLSLAELVEKAVAGEIEPDDLVKNADGLWAKARDIDFLQQLFRLRESRGKASQPAPYRSGRETKALGGGLLLVLVGAACIWGICTLIDSARSRFSNNDRSWNAKIEKNDPGWNAKFYADRGWDSIKKKDYDAAIRDSSEANRGLSWPGVLPPMRAMSGLRGEGGGRLRCGRCEPPARPTLFISPPVPSACSWRCKAF
jgi:hypothetical protein